MVTPDKLPNALYALQALLIHARFLALTDNDAGKKIASLLDYAEHLPHLIACPTDETASFRENLVSAASQHRCPVVLQRFDEPVPPNW